MAEVNLDTIRYIPARWQGSVITPTMIVLHDMEAPETPTMAENCAIFFRDMTDPKKKASCNYCIDVDSTVCSVKPNVEAYHAGVGAINRCSIGIEQSGYARQTGSEWLDYYGQQMIFGQLIPLIKALMKRYGIKPVFLTGADLKAGKRNGITTHGEVTKGFDVSGGHTDPGANYPIDVVMKALQAPETPDEEEFMLKQVLLRDERNGAIYVCTVGIPIAVKVDNLNDVAYLKALGVEDRTSVPAAILLDTMAKFNSPVAP